MEEGKKRKSRGGREKGRMERREFLSIWPLI